MPEHNESDYICPAITSLATHILSWHKDYKNQNSKNRKDRNRKTGREIGRTRIDGDSAMRRIWYREVYQLPDMLKMGIISYGQSFQGSSFRY